MGFDLIVEGRWQTVLGDGDLRHSKSAEKPSEHDNMRLPAGLGARWRREGAIPRPERGVA